MPFRRVSRIISLFVWVDERRGLHRRIHLSCRTIYRSSIECRASRPPQLLARGHRRPEGSRTLLAHRLTSSETLGFLITFSGPLAPANNGRNTLPSNSARNPKYMLNYSDCSVRHSRRKRTSGDRESVFCARHSVSVASETLLVAAVSLPHRPSPAQTATRRSKEGSQTSGAADRANKPKNACTNLLAKHCHEFAFQ